MLSFSPHPFLHSTLNLFLLVIPQSTTAGGGLQYTLWQVSWSRDGELGLEGNKKGLTVELSLGQYCSKCPLGFLPLGIPP